VRASVADRTRVTRGRLADRMDNDRGVSAPIKTKNDSKRGGKLSYASSRDHKVGDRKHRDE